MDQLNSLKNVIQINYFFHRIDNISVALKTILLKKHLRDDKIISISNFFCSEINILNLNKT